MRKYCIGFFSVILIVFSVITVGYQLTYEYTNTKAQQSKEQMLKEHIEKSGSISTKGDAVKNNGYYISSLQGYIVVYCDDHKTVYEVTDIPINSLPKDIQEKIMDSMYIESAEELYQFLENYSS